MFLREILAIMHGFSTALQQDNINWVAARGELEACKTLMKKLSAEEITQKVYDVCSDIGIAVDYEDPVYKTRSKKKVTDYFKADSAEIKHSILEKVNKLIQISTDKLYKDLDHRFKSLSSPLFESLLALDAASKDQFLDYKTLLPLLEHYEERIHVNKILLENECKRAKIICETGNTITPELFPNIQTVLKMHNTLPVSTATVERGFSCMNRIITYARNSLLSTLASDLIRLSLNKDILKDLDLDKAVDDWARKRTRRFIPLN